MSRVLLVDDSPHAQRMGERILTEEGYEVVTVSNADSALVRLDDVDPDIVLADTVMPGRTGFEICQYLKMSPRHKHVRVILTAGVLEPLDEAHTKRVEADGVLKKPFEASALLAAVKPLAEAAVRAREGSAAAGTPPKGAGPGERVSTAPFIAVVDAEQVRAAVTIAMDASMDKLVDEIARRVLATLNSTKKPDPRPLESSIPPPVAAPVPSPPVPAAPPRIAESGPIAPPSAAEPMTAITPVAPRVQATRIEPVRRISPLRLRTGGILGIDINRPEPPELPPADTNSPADE
jgi:CheY-like chemotaxis protein